MPVLWPSVQTGRRAYAPTRSIRSARTFSGTDAGSRGRRTGTLPTIRTAAGCRRDRAVALPAGGGGGGAGGGARDGAVPWTAMRRERAVAGARALQGRRPPENPRPPALVP